MSMSSIFESLDDIGNRESGLDASSLEPVERLREVFEQVPKRCRSCFFLKHTGRLTLHLVQQYVDNYDTAFQLMDDENRNSPEDILENAQQHLEWLRNLTDTLGEHGVMVEDFDPNITVEEFVDKSFEESHEEIEQMREASLEAADVVRSIYMNCKSGPLKLKGKTDDKSFKVTLCTSDYNVHMIDNPDHYPSRVNVKSTTEQAE